MTPGHAPRLRFQIKDIDTTVPGEVCALVTGMFREMYPQEASDYIERRFAAVAAMFAGDYEGFLPMDTAYHDLEHTLQATLCLVRLLNNRHFAQAQPRIKPLDFNTALIAILLHDMGYLKEVGDTEGTGAKYTHIHEQRSCAHARRYLQSRDWSERQIQRVEHFISCTGPNAKLSAIPFFDECDAMLGRVVCTADFIGQMSDPRYVEKLPTLYREFCENYEARGLKPEDRPFHSYEDLLQKTPGFWQHFVIPRMERDCHNLWQFFADPFTGEDAYRPAVEANIAAVRQRLQELG